MSNIFQIIEKGSSLDFVFDRSGESIEGWICRLVVKVNPADSAEISRVIPPAGRTWPGIITSAEITALASFGAYRAVGILVNASTDQEEQVPVKFHISASWA